VGSGIWVCPGQTDDMRARRNTFAFSIAATLEKNPPNQSTTVFVWDRP
jgi:hypothetical protein